MEGAYIAEIHDDSLPADWVLIEGQFELDDVWAAQLRGGEANEKTMTVAEREQMVAAKVKELTSFFDNQVWDFVEVGKIKPERVVTARWVLTWKTDQDTGLQKAKARLVLKGFQDPDIMTMEKTAPTASKSSKMMLLALTPNMGWSIMCGDVRAAFLSGSTFKREIIVKLPKDCGPLLGIPVEETFMKMNKSAYGLCDAPLLWWKEADRRLRQLRMVRHRLDKCCYMLYDEQQRLVTLLILHVDDILLGLDKQSPVTKTFVVGLKKAFDFGKWDELTVERPVHYCGGRICLLKDGSVSLDFQEYVRKVMPVTIAKGRKSEDHMTAAEISKARGLLGALQWPATQACPHLNATVSLLAADISNGKIKVLEELNKALRFAKSATDFKIVMKKVVEEVTETCFLCYSDAAFGVRTDGASQGGYILVMTSGRALKGESVPYNVVGWRSFKLNQVCRSSLSAESQACSGALDELVMIKTLAALMFDQTLDPRADQTAAGFGSSAIIIDAKGLYDALRKDGIGSGADKRASIDILCTKEEIARTGCELRWVSSERMLADGLTKLQARQGFLSMLGSGYLKLVNDETFTAAKKKDKYARAVSTASTFGRNKIAEKISLVVMAQAVTPVEAMSEEGNDTGMFYVLLTIAVANTLLVLFYGLSYVKGIFVPWFKSLLPSHASRFKEASTQTEVYGSSSASRASLSRNFGDERLRDVGHGRRITELNQERARSSLVHSLVLHEELQAFYTRYGQCWHIFQDCRTLTQASSVLTKGHLCKVCIDRASERERQRD